MSIEIRNVSKNFGNFQALGDVSLDIESGEHVISAEVPHNTPLESIQHVAKKPLSDRKSVV